jgi:iron complex outermembrane receptor protein
MNFDGKASQKRQRWLAFNTLLLCGASSIAIAHAQVVNLPVNAGEVSASAIPSTSTALPSQKAILKSGQTEKILSKAALRNAGAGSNAAQALSLAPGVNASSYSGSAGAKYTISINGIKTGWAGFGGGNVDDGSIMVTFDGVPMNNPGTGLWQSNQIPELSLIKGIGLVYGPGSVANRWYDNIGGAINFVPLEPTAKPSAAIGIGYGSLGTKNLHFDVSSGVHDGWSAIIAGGETKSNSYRTGYGFQNPGDAFAYYAKLKKQFSNGSISFGAYDARAEAYRPLPIPVNPIAGVTVNGYDAAGTPNPGLLYSEKTSGFYGSLPYGLIHKLDLNSTWMAYARLRLDLTKSLKFTNLLYYRHGNRFHGHNDQYFPTDAFRIEYNNPYSEMVGDKFTFSAKLPYNTVDFGGFFVNNTYNSHNVFYNPLAGTSPTIPSGFRNDFFYQTDLGAFVQDHIALTPRFDITPGLRVVNFQTRYENNGTATYPQANPANDEALLPNAATNFSKVEPNVSANWRAEPWLAIYGNYGFTYRQPPNGGGGGPYQALLASSLKLEKGTSYQIGFKIHGIRAPYLHRFLIGANYYHLLYSNETIPIPVLNQPFELNASGSSVYHGVNIYADDDPISDLHLFTNLSLQKSYFQQYEVGGVSYNGLPVSNIADATFNVGASYRYYFDRMNFVPRLWYQYTGSQYLFNDLTGAPTRTKMPAYGVLNASLRISKFTGSFVSPLKTVSLQIIATNILNNQYNVAEYITAGGYFGAASAGQILGFPGAPRAVFADLSGHF